MMCKMMISPGFKILIFQAVRGWGLGGGGKKAKNGQNVLIFLIVSGVKVQKMPQNDKMMSLTLHISRSTHHTIVIFGTHV